MIVLGIDPGAKNVAWAICKCHTFQRKTPVGVKGRHVYDPKRGVKTKVLKCGIFQNLVTDLTNENCQQQVDAFASEVLWIIEEYKPIQIWMERFQSRGRIGNVAEVANILIGIILTIASSNGRSIKTQLITAATWKNRANDVFDLNNAYKQVRTTPHELDARLIAEYGASKTVNARPFHELGTKKRRFMRWDELEGVANKLRRVMNKNKRTI